MSSLFFLRAAAVLGALAVGIGAFGAHGLRGKITPDLLEIFETGVKYHFYHTLALLALALLPATVWQGRWAAAAGWSWIIGVLIFSGSLYLLAITGTRWLGAITPIGGVAFILGWCFLFLAASTRGEQ
jgi:uncharacterized membrane protein YgdD (TMEM256/DUF423 family)